MLDRAKVIEVLRLNADRLFIDMSESSQVARQAWQEICNDPTFVYKVRSCLDAPWPVPDWSDPLNTTVFCQKDMLPYVAISVDGSQIYPDRHYGISCFLINIGTVVIPYVPDEKVVLTNTPYIFTPDDEWQSVANSTDFVNAKRQELEFAHAVQTAIGHQNKNTQHRQLILFDGSLIFWHLASKDMTLQTIFLPLYINSLLELYEKKIPIAGYVSLPKSKELVNLVRLFLCNFDTSQESAYASVNNILDTTILSNFLSAGCRTGIFKNQSGITKQYPAYIHPHFFYLNVGREIARVEVPYWMTLDEELISEVASQILGQCQIGDGYPFTIAEAHEQAVVKGADRDFFYFMLDKLGTERNYRSAASIKSVRKKRMGF